jgi:transposase
VISVGVDAHKQLHVALALDDGGRELSQWRGPNTRAGWRSFSRWLNTLDPERQTGIEGAWGYGRGLAQHLVDEGEQVFEINARWTAAGRRSARRTDKSDRLDAHAVALCLHREGDRLPQVTADDVTAVLELLSVEREATVAEATRLRNQIHALLTQLDPEYKQSLPNLKTKSALVALRDYEASDSGVLNQERASTVRRLAERLTLALRQASELTKHIRMLAAERFTPLTEICGINLLTAGNIAGILGPGRRFPNDAALAAYAGVAPLEASSAGKTRHRLNRGGNRRLNSILYRIVLTQAHYSDDGRAYLERRVREGKTKREAMRALKRYIVRAIWHAWQNCDLADDLAEARSAA